MKDTYELNIQSSAADMYEQYTRYSYTEAGALAEFIDNSTASFFINESRLSEIHSNKLHIYINYDAITNTLTIEDDAFGMEKEEFDRALVVGKIPIVVWRNEFGYGLKTAATWFGRHWSVESSQYGSETKYFGYIDLDELHASGKNEIPIIKSNAAYDEHYTKITISKIVRRLNTNAIKKKIVGILNSLYRRDLITGKIEITYNGITLSFTENEPLFFRNQIWKKDISFSFVVQGNLYSVTGFVGILQNGSFKKTGFALLRNKRVIVDAYKPEEIYKQAQSYISKNLYGELNMESFKVNQAKDGFGWTPDVEETFISYLKQNIQDYIDVAKLTNEQRQLEESENQENEEDNSDSSSQNENSLNNSNNGSTNNDNQLLNGDNESITNENEQVNNENELVTDDNSGNNEHITSVVQEYKFNLIIDSKVYEIEWKTIDDLYFLYKFEGQKLIVNMNHIFAKNCNLQARKDVSKVILSYVLAEQQAQLSANSDGYVPSTMLRNKLNKILSDY